VAYRPDSSRCARGRSLLCARSPGQLAAAGARGHGAAMARCRTTREERGWGMIDVTIETEIERPHSGRGVAYVTDPTKLAPWPTTTVSAVPETDGPLRVGSRVREVHRAPGGKKIEELVEVAEYEPDRVLGLRNIEGPPVGGRITLEPTERGTRFRFRVHGQPTERRASSNRSSGSSSIATSNTSVRRSNAFSSTPRSSPDTVRVGRGALTGAQ